MQDLSSSERDSLQSEPQQPSHPSQSQSHRHQDYKPMFFEEVLDFDQGSSVAGEGAQEGRGKVEESALKKAKRYFLKGVYEVFSFFNSPAFSLRITQLLTVIIIQRYNNVFSLVALLWLALVSTT